MQSTDSIKTFNEDYEEQGNANATQIGTAVATGMYRYLNNGQYPPSSGDIKKTQGITNSQAQTKQTPSSAPNVPKARDPNEIHSFGDFLREASRWLHWNH